MLVLNTRFPISPSATVDDLMLLGNKWIRESPHCCMREEVAQYSSCCKSYEVHKENEKFEIIRAEDTDKTLCGMRYKREDGGPVFWTTDVVGVKTSKDFSVSIQIHCESSNIHFRPNAKKPYIIKLIDREIGFSQDGVFPINSDPVYFSHDDVGLASSVINGDRCCSLPCVYVSINNSGHYSLSEKDLAWQLLGIAHVVVEPNRYFSYDLQSSTNGRNAYNGAVGVYFPTSSQYLIILPDGGGSAPHIDRDKIYIKIRDALLLQQISREFTYSSVVNLNYKGKIAEIEKIGDKRISEYVNSFDSELFEKDDEINKLRAEILYYQNRLLTQQAVDAKEGCSPLLYRGEMSDAYQGEAHDAVIVAIKEFVDNVKCGKRKGLVLQGVIAANAYVGGREKLADKIKELFKSYSSMTPVIKGELQKIGLNVEEGGKHYKLFFRDNSDCFTTLVKTGSDKRGGKNTARDIVNVLL